MKNTDDPVLPRWFLGTRAPSHEDGALWECPRCRRWWKYRLHTTPPHNGPGYVTLAPEHHPRWVPVSVWDVKARRRIAAHESVKMHDRSPTTVGTLHWWDCHPNPRRGRP